jgi:hypothetical protein
MFFLSLGSPQDSRLTLSRNAAGVRLVLEEGLQERIVTSAAIRFDSDRVHVGV